MPPLLPQQRQTRRQALIRKMFSRCWRHLGQRYPKRLHAAAAPMPIPRRQRAARRSTVSDRVVLWVMIGGLALAALFGVYLLLNRQTWEEEHRTQIEAMKTDAESLLQGGQPKPAYDHYKELFAFVGDHEIKSLSIKDDLEIARAGMETARVAAAPLIAKEEAERRRRKRRAPRQ